MMMRGCHGACVPQELQLRVILVERHGFDALEASGTGSGKTLPFESSGTRKKGHQQSDPSLSCTWIYV